jgi:hypothetical protein
MSGGGEHNAEAGSSRPKAYWELQEEMESQEPWSNPNYVPPDEDMEDVDASSDDDDDMMEEDEGDATTTNGDGGGGGATSGGSQGSRKRKDRNPVTVGLVRQAFTLVSPKGVPKEPKEFAAGYGLQVAAILRNTVTINTGTLTSRENTHYREMLLRKLHARYKFPDDDKYNNTNVKGNPVNKEALRKMTKALGNWKARVKRYIYTDKLSYEEIIKKEPMVTEEHLKEFEANCETDAAKARSARGKEMKELNIGNHTLGSGGYRAAAPKWAAEDKAAIERGEQPPFAHIVEEQTKNFLRARCPRPKKGSSTYSEPQDEKVQAFMRNYVSNSNASRFTAF